MTTIFIDPNNPDEQALHEAAAIIMQGGIAIYPTETVYGIGVRYDDKQALERLFDLKNRAQHKPVLLLLPRSEDLQRISSHIPPEARLLAERFWPGPLTLVVPAAPDLSALITGGGATVLTGPLPILPVDAPAAAAVATLVFAALGTVV